MYIYFRDDTRIRNFSDNFSIETLHSITLKKDDIWKDSKGLEILGDHNGSMRLFFLVVSLRSKNCECPTSGCSYGGGNVIKM